jgi:hypothetical protein
VGAARIVVAEELRDTARELVGQHWPVLRGTYFDGAHWHGYPGVVDLRPVDENWSTAWTLDPNRVGEWWSELPYTVLVACGHGVDCLEVPASTGPWVLQALRLAGVRLPAMLTPVNSLVVFARTETAPGRVLASASWRSIGSWVPMPPGGRYIGRVGTRTYRWLPGLSPRDVHWKLGCPVHHHATCIGSYLI